MKKAFLIAAIILSLATSVYAIDRDAPRRGGPPQRGAQIHRAVTPYGDFCPNCSVYGVRYKQVGHKKAVSAMTAYFHKKGYSIRNVRGVGRFLKVDVYKRGMLVDRIIFDRKTGRIRSIY